MANLICDSVYLNSKAGIWGLQLHYRLCLKLGLKMKDLRRIIANLQRLVTTLYWICFANFNVHPRWLGTLLKYRFLGGT